MLCWEIWNHRNSILFEGQPKSIWKVVLKVANVYGEFHKEKIKKM